MIPIFFDTETSYKYNLPWIKGAYPVTLCLKIGSEMETFIFNHTDRDYIPANLKKIQEYFARADILVAHNAKFDLHWLRAIGVDFSDKRIYCTMVTEYLLNSQRIGDLSLHDMSIRYELPSKIDLVKEWWDSGYETDEIPLSILIPYGEQDVLNCEAIYYKQIPQIKAQGKGQLVKLRCESLKITQEIEWNGMHLDTTLAQELSEEYGARMKEIEDAIQICIEEALPEIKDIPYKMTSGDHLSAILFGGIIKYDGKETVIKVLKGGREKECERKAKLCISTLGLGFKPASGTETAKQGYYKTDVGQLSMLKPETEAQRLFLSLTQELAKLDKMKGTYCDGLLAVHIDGVVHPTMNECVTKTGRYSSKNPNSQNLPREGTSPVKKLFVTRYKER